MFFDTHCHLDFSDFDNDREKIIKQAMDENIGLIINPGVDLISTKKASEIAKQFDIVYFACGIHPHNADGINDELFDECMKLAGERKFVGIGETGLDFFYNNSDAAAQIKLFRKHINFARNNNFPLIVHQRNAQSAIMEIFNEIKLPSKVVFHCFVGDEKFLDWTIQKGFYVSFTGIITFNNAVSVKKTAEKVRLERVFFETDAPYLAPHPVRGKRNEPRFVRFIVEEFAKIRKMSVSDILEITTNNASVFFNISI